jgi:hypothetical protein
MDDLNILHFDHEVVSSVIGQLNKTIGQVAPLTKTQGLVHGYLGMTINYSTPDKVRILMIDYIQGMLYKLPANMDGEATSPAVNHLFEMNKRNPVMLDEPTSVLFHHNVAKLLFLCKGARPNIQTAVAFLCTRVIYKKLTQVVRYL